MLKTNAARFGLQLSPLPMSIVPVLVSILAPSLQWSATRQPFPESGRDDLALLLYLHYQPMLIDVR